MPFKIKERFLFYPAPFSLKYAKKKKQLEKENRNREIVDLMRRAIQDENNGEQKILY
jgi:hypothetical protein